MRGFCFPAIRQGYSRDALHQYPCHIVVERQPQLQSLGIRRGFIICAIWSGLLSEYVPYYTLSSYARALNQIAHLVWQGKRFLSV